MKTQKNKYMVLPNMPRVYGREINKAVFLRYFKHISNKDLKKFVYEYRDGEMILFSRGNDKSFYILKWKKRLTIYVILHRK
jgi:hypothetical protein